MHGRPFFLLPRVSQPVCVQNQWQRKMAPASDKLFLKNEGQAQPGSATVALFPRELGWSDFNGFTDYGEWPRLREVRNFCERIWQNCTQALSR